MSFLQLLAMFSIAIVGLWLIHRCVPLNDNIMIILNVVVVVFVWASSAFFVVDAFSSFHIGE